MFTFDERAARFTGLLSAHRDTLGLVWAQMPDAAIVPLGRRVDLTFTLDVERLP